MEYESRTIVQLKAILTERGLSTKHRKKSDLVQRLVEADEQAEAERPKDEVDLQNNAEELASHETSMPIDAACTQASEEKPPPDKVDAHREHDNDEKESSPIPGGTSSFQNEEHTQGEGRRAVDHEPPEETTELKATETDKSELKPHQEGDPDCEEKSNVPADASVRHKTDDKNGNERSLNGIAENRTILNNTPAEPEDEGSDRPVCPTEKEVERPQSILDAASEEDVLSMGDTDESNDEDGNMSPSVARSAKVERAKDISQPMGTGSDNKLARFRPISYNETDTSPAVVSKSNQPEKEHGNPPAHAENLRARNHKEGDSAHKQRSFGKHSSSTERMLPVTRNESTEIGKDSSIGNGSKRKRSMIVFDPPSAPAHDNPPQKRDKVDLVVQIATEATCALRIDGLKRPLKEHELKDILQEHGEIQGFWIDSCKTHCYVVYSSQKEAQNTYVAVDGRAWPPRCHSFMKPSFVTREEATVMIDSRGNATLTRVESLTSAKHQNRSASKDQADLCASDHPKQRDVSGGSLGTDRGGAALGVCEQRDAEMSDRGARNSTEPMLLEPDREEPHRHAVEILIEDSGAHEQEGNRTDGRANFRRDEDMNDTVDVDDARRRPANGQGNAGEMISAAALAPTSIFKLTKTQPAIFWLPLSDEDVEKRKIEQEKKAEQRRLLEQVRKAGRVAIKGGDGNGDASRGAEDGTTTPAGCASESREGKSKAMDQVGIETERAGVPSN